MSSSRGCWVNYGTSKLGSTLQILKRVREQNVLCRQKKNLQDIKKEKSKIQNICCVYVGRETGVSAGAVGQVVSLKLPRIWVLRSCLRLTAAVTRSRHFFPSAS